MIKESTCEKAIDTEYQPDGEKTPVVCVGQANLGHIQRTTVPSQLPNICLANELARQGIQTWVFITPALPGITDVKAMIQALPADIPVYLDKLRLKAGGDNTVRILKHLDRYFPSLKPR